MPDRLDRESRAGGRGGTSCAGNPLSSGCIFSKSMLPLNQVMQEQRVAGVRSGRGHAAQHRLDMIGRVVALPCELIGALPLLPRHPRMRGADVIEVVLVQVGVERSAGA